MSAFRTLQEECCEANGLLQKLHLVDMTFGNASVMDRRRGVFAIKPSGVPYDALRPRDIVVLDLNGQKVEGRLRPSSDTSTHRRLFLAFPETRAVVHTHSRHAVAFAQAGRPIPCLGTTHADFFRGEVPVTRPMTAREIRRDYEWETGGVIVERFGKLNPSEIRAVLVRGHGPFVWGGSGKEAVEIAQALEIVAEMAWRTLQIAPQASLLPALLRDQHFLRKHGPRAAYGQPAS